jgi:hypothetical protein
MGVGSLEPKPYISGWSRGRQADTAVDRYDSHMGTAKITTDKGGRAVDYDGQRWQGGRLRRTKVAGR